ncbi:alpha/beta hydrolase [Paenibacillus sp. LHD-117]|uniref:alpha/beta hydrolase n=1 Tax=Paenibacillus sp. LHD-117 TaxID=3071412 RepID=UPI0027E15C46|nr:alpha/beta fold hydrolase [Paenibacillus sp. LHD-117]MDQ6423564.1 alpha/beta hydrolase [Paenibacillus sp. LHD-117]
MNLSIGTPQPLESVGLSAVPQALPLPPFLRTNIAAQRRKHKWIATIASMVAMCFIAVIIFHGYVAWMLAYPYVAPLSSNPQEAIGVDYEEVVFPSNSGDTTVSGWYVPAITEDGSSAPSNRTVVFSHGYGANREESWVPMYELTELLHDLRYNVLLFDYGYASEQYKAPATGGREESQQLLASVNYARSRGAEDIVVWGFSMGAGTALQTALVTDEIDAMILDSLFVPSSEALFDNLNQFVELPRFPSLPLIESMIPLWTGTDFGSIPADQVVQHAYDMPIYVIHGTEDAKASFETAETIATNQANVLSRSWIVEDGQHELLFRKHPTEYIGRTALFLSQVDSAIASDRELLQ